MNYDGSIAGIGIFFILIAIASVIFYLLPIFIAFNRNHEYRWVIFVLTIVGGWTGLMWLVAFAWAVFPQNKTFIDLVVGNATGLGYRNSGDALGEADYGRIRGYRAAKAQNGVRIQPNLNAQPDPVHSVNSKLDALERLQVLRVLITI